MLILIAALLAACISVLAHDNHQTRKAFHTMSKALDALTDKVSNLETQGAAVVAQVATLQAAGENAPALDALGVRVQAVADQLQVAAAPKA